MYIVPIGTELNVPIGTECTVWNWPELELDVPIGTYWMYQLCNPYLIVKYYLFEFGTECITYI